jgi:DNA-binding NarL/FixJ family response regulator
VASGVDKELAAVVEALVMGKNRYVQAFLALDLTDPNAYIDAYAPDMRSRDIVLRIMAQGQRQCDVAKAYGLSRSRIHQILNMTLRKLVRLHKGGKR